MPDTLFFGRDTRPARWARDVPTGNSDLATRQEALGYRGYRTAFNDRWYLSSQNTPLLQGHTSSDAHEQIVSGLVLIWGITNKTPPFLASDTPPTPQVQNPSGGNELEIDQAWNARTSWWTGCTGRHFSTQFSPLTVMDGRANGKTVQRHDIARICAFAPIVDMRWPSTVHKRAHTYNTHKCTEKHIQAHTHTRTQVMLEGKERLRPRWSPKGWLNQLALSRCHGTGY